MKKNCSSYIITIDGPAGAGKSTIAKALSKKLGFIYIDTGAMYRALTLKVLMEGVDPKDHEDVGKVSKSSEMKIDYDEDGMNIFLDGENVKSKIRAQEVTENTSAVSAVEAVRNKMMSIQRRTAKKFKTTVFEGRDMGSVVFPGADLKIYLDAGVEERARRRWKELKAKGQSAEKSKVIRSIEKRDKYDRSRKVAPLTVPQDAVIIDTTGKSILEVTEEIISLVNK